MDKTKKEDETKNSIESTKSKHKQLIWVFFFVFIDVLGFSLILPLLPYYSKEFNASPSIVGLLLTTNAFTQMISAPFLGWLSDIYGRRPILLVCIFGTIMGFIIMAESHSLEMLFFSRILDGLLGGNIALAQAYVSDVTGTQDRSKGFGYIGAGFSL